MFLGVNKCSKMFSMSLTHVILVIHIVVIHPFINSTHAGDRCVLRHSTAILSLGQLRPGLEVWFFRGLAPNFLLFASMIFLQTYMGTSLMAYGCTSWVLNALQSACVKQWLVIGLTNKCATNSNRHYNIILWKPDAIFCSTLELKPILVLTLKGLLISPSLRGKRWKANTKAGHAPCVLEGLFLKGKFERVLSWILFAAYLIFFCRRYFLFIFKKNWLWFSGYGH